MTFTFYFLCIRPFICQYFCNICRLLWLLFAPISVKTASRRYYGALSFKETLSKGYEWQEEEQKMSHQILLWLPFFFLCEISKARNFKQITDTSLPPPCSITTFIYDTSHYWKLSPVISVTVWHQSRSFDIHSIAINCRKVGRQSVISITPSGVKGQQQRPSAPSSSWITSHTGDSKPSLSLSLSQLSCSISVGPPFLSSSWGPT